VRKPLLRFLPVITALMVVFGGMPGVASAQLASCGGRSATPLQAIGKWKQMGVWRYGVSLMRRDGFSSVDFPDATNLVATRVVVAPLASAQVVGNTACGSRHMVAFGHRLRPKGYPMGIFLPKNLTKSDLCAHAGSSCRVTKVKVRALVQMLCGNGTPSQVVVVLIIRVHAPPKPKPPAKKPVKPKPPVPTPPAVQQQAPPPAIVINNTNVNNNTQNNNQNQQQNQAQQQCAQAGGNWTNNTCDMTLVIEQQQCVQQGGTWNSQTQKCVFPPPPPPPPSTFTATASATATQSATASATASAVCPGGSTATATASATASATATATASATATSSVSQQDANNKAQTQASTLANADAKSLAQAAAQAQAKVNAQAAASANCPALAPKPSATASASCPPSGSNGAITVVLSNTGSADAVIFVDVNGSVTTYTVHPGQTQTPSFVLGTSVDVRVKASSNGVLLLDQAFPHCVPPPPPPSPPSVSVNFVQEIDASNGTSTFTMPTCGQVMAPSGDSLSITFHVNHGSYGTDGSGTATYNTTATGSSQSFCPTYTSPTEGGLQDQVTMTVLDNKTRLSSSAKSNLFDIVTPTPNP
jgi:hypothetical protein